MCGSEGIDSGIVDEDVDLIICEFNGFLCHFACADRIPKIRGDKICPPSSSANLVHGFLPAVRVSPHNQDMNSELSQFPGRRQADSARPPVTRAVDVLLIRYASPICDNTLLEAQSP